VPNPLASLLGSRRINRLRNQVDQALNRLANLRRSHQCNL
jgi:hypothetical protein